MLSRGRPALSYAGLFDQVTRTLGSLNRAGYGRGDRIATALPPGPETAVAAISLLSGCVCVPLNPGSSASDLQLLLSRARAVALITTTAFFPNVVEAATACGIPVIDLETLTGEAAGRFVLRLDARRRNAMTGFSTASELAAVFATSGTTGTPKLIPLSQDDMHAHGERAKRYLGLTSSDRCIDLLPPFHHDAIAVTLLSIVFAGGSTVYPSAMPARHFAGWVRAFRPTWCAASPPFFQLLYGEFQGHAEVLADLGLRTLFTCGAPLDERTLAGVEDMLGAPLRNSYGATECGGISINPAPPAQAKRGSVGLGVGLDIRIVDETGTDLPTGEAGEVVVRGPGVFRGYEADPDQNAGTFFGDWYRTGDQGYFDQDSYLFLTGRTQETINRGGQKIAPLEIDEVLQSHPDVVEAAAFAVPHRVLGEDVAAVVVTRPPGLDAEEIRRYAVERLSAFKVPRTILIVPAIPKGPTGKVQRRRLADIFSAELRDHADASVRPRARGTSTDQT